MKVNFINDELGLEYPRLVFREKAYWNVLRLMHSNHAKTKEFMFHGQIEKRLGNTFIVEDVQLMPNIKCSGAYCESDPEKYSDWFMETYGMIRADRERVRLHVHSHVNMSTGPSGTDNEQLKDFAKNTNDYYIQLIINHKAENTCNIWDKKGGFKYEEVPIYAQIGSEYLIEPKTKKLFKFKEEENGITLGKFEAEIPNGNYEVKDGLLIINENIQYNFMQRNFLVKSELLGFEDGGLVFYTTKEEDQQIEDLFKEMIKDTTPAYASPYSHSSKVNTTPKGSTPYPSSRTPYYGGYYGGYYNGYSDYEDYYGGYNEKEKEDPKGSVSTTKVVTGTSGDKFKTISITRKGGIK